MTPRISRLLELGRARFNSGRYFEAHEAWEEAWLTETGETKRLLQGLIQIAAGCHKAYEKGQRTGCARLLETGVSKLTGSWKGLALDAFVLSVRAALEEVRRWERGEAAGMKTTGAPRLLRADGDRERVRN